MIPTFTPEQAKELKVAATYISQLPPLDEWIHIKPELNLNFSMRTEVFWQWLGKSLEAFFDNDSNPISDPKVEEQLLQCASRMPQLIQFKTTQYILYAVLIFQAEKYLEKEAEKAELNYCYKRSELLKILALEECKWSILISIGDFESPSYAQICNRLRDWHMYQSEKIDENTLLNRVKQWDKEDAKLLNTLPPDYVIRPWTNFCNCVFEKYRAELPAIEAFDALLKPPKETDFRADFRKFGVFAGEYREHSRNKKKRRDS